MKTRDVLIEIKQYDPFRILGLNQKPYSPLEKIIFEYGNISQKMKNFEQQSWYFKKGKKNNLVKLNKLKSQFEEIRERINTIDTNRSIKSLNDYKEKLKIIQDIKPHSFIRAVRLGGLEYNIVYIEQLLVIKSRVDEIKDLDYYLENENKEELIKLLGS